MHRRGLAGVSWGRGSGSLKREYKGIRDAGFLLRLGLGFRALGFWGLGFKVFGVLGLFGLRV